jgi:DNA-binding MarR family transcriptional regulator
MVPTDQKLSEIFDREEFERMLQEATAKSQSIWEEGFVESVRDRYTRYRMNTFVSEKQLEILERISSR